MPGTTEQVIPACVPVTPPNRSSPVTSWISHSLDWINVVQALTRWAAETAELSVSNSSDTAHISARLTFLLLRVSVTSTDSACEPAPSPSPRSSLTHAHRCIGSRNPTGHLATSAGLMYLSVCESRDSACEPVPPPSPRSPSSRYLLRHTNVLLGFRNSTSARPLPPSARSMYLNSMYDVPPSV
jgi:hypothetical protein